LRVTQQSDFIRHCATFSCPLGSAPLDLQQPVLCSRAEFSPLRCGVYHQVVFRQSTTAAGTLGFLPCSEIVRKFHSAHKLYPFGQLTLSFFFAVKTVSEERTGNWMSLHDDERRNFKITSVPSLSGWPTEELVLDHKCVLFKLYLPEESGDSRPPKFLTMLIGYERQ
jgi:hypothetical protein